MIRTRAGCRIATCMLLLASVAAAALTDNEKTAVDQLTAMSSAQFQTLQMQAAKGAPSAQALLGIAYLKGVRVPQDQRAAFALFTKAAKKQPVAMSNLGIMYFYGMGVAFSSGGVDSLAVHLPSVVDATQFL